MEDELMNGSKWVWSWSQARGAEPGATEKKGDWIDGGGHSTEPHCAIPTLLALRADDTRGARGGARRARARTHAPSVP